MLIITFWVALFLVVYVYAGYPLLLYVLSRRHKPEITPEALDFTPKVTLLISAYNEEAIIGEKLKNTLALDYPKDNLQVIVISDASTDKTDAIVKSFENEGVLLIRLEKQQGKTAGLNQAIVRANGEVVVFSDANSMYEPQTLRALVRHFINEKVGYVVGEQRYRPSKSGAAENESLYWRYEQFIKRRESQLSSVVGGDGAIYAIRRKLYKSLQTTDISDFVNPLQIIAQDRTGVYEPKAVCWENAAGTYEGEFRRKMRIVNRSLWGFWRVRKAVNVRRRGYFTWQLVSHKVIRWFVPFFMIALLVSNAVLAFRAGVSFYRVLFVLQLCGYTLAALGGFFRNSILSIPYYFCMVNVASLIGVCMALVGKVITKWEPKRDEPIERT